MWYLYLFLLNAGTYFFVFPEKCNLFWQFSNFMEELTLRFDFFFFKCFFKELLLANPEDERGK